MEFKVRLFATLKDLAGRDVIVLELDAPSDVEALLKAVSEQHPVLKPALPTTLVAVNRAFAGPETSLSVGDEIGLFPPVSGGNPTFFLVTEQPVKLEKIHAKIAGPDVGAIVTFSGSVRGTTSREGLPTTTLHLEYEAYESMAEQKMAQIAVEIWQRWPLVKGIAIVQRVGKLKVGETTTIVACASAHRDQGAFEAARYGIDRLKEIVPVWKKEVGEDKSIWIEGDYQPTEADNL